MDDHTPEPLQPFSQILCPHCRAWHPAVIGHPESTLYTQAMLYWVCRGGRYYTGSGATPAAILRASAQCHQLRDNRAMPPQWNPTTLVHSVQLDYEKTPKLRPVRLAGPVARVGDPARIVVSGVEIEGQIAGVAEGVLRVKVKATQLRAAPPIKRARRA